MTKRSNAMFPGAEWQGEDLERTVGLIRFSTESAERLLKLQMEMAQGMFAESIQGALALAQATDPKDAMALRVRLAQDGTQTLLRHANRLQDAALEVRGKLMALSLSAGGAERAGAGTSDAGVDHPLQAMLSSATSAVEAMLEAGRQASERIQGGMREAAGSMAGGGAGKASKAAPAGGKRRGG